jgi:hypothetical protein
LADLTGAVSRSQPNPVCHETLDLRRPAVPYDPTGGHGTELLINVPAPDLSTHINYATADDARQDATAGERPRADRPLASSEVQTAGSCPLRTPRGYAVHNGAPANVEGVG